MHLLQITRRRIMSPNPAASSASNASRTTGGGSPDRRSIEELFFDPLNPRLPDGFEKASQAELLKTLADEYELQDLGQSLADNGYFAEEPLVAVPRADKKGFIVVEGNRRLAALKLLQNPSLAGKGQRARWQQIKNESRSPITQVPIIIYRRREEIIPYLGFRHITGVLGWQAYPKARYIAQLVESSQMSFAEIARVIGSKPKIVREHYVVYAILRQAENAFGIDTEKARESLGVLRRALSDPNIRNFIGLSLDQSESKLAKPVPARRGGELKELLSWMFGDRTDAPVMSDSRRITDLGVVLASNEATRLLRSTRDLDHAFQLAGGEEARLLESLDKASYYLDQALPLALRHKESKNVLLAVQRCQRVFVEIERHFPGVKG